MTMGLYGIGLPYRTRQQPRPEDLLTEIEIFAEVQAAYWDSQPVWRIATDLLKAVTAGQRFDPQEWCRLYDAIHAARRDEGVVPKWSSMTKGMFVNLRIISEAAKAQNQG